MMKKIISLILSMIMALSMGTTAFASDIMELELPNPANAMINIPVVDFCSDVLYSHAEGSYYVALEDQPYKNISLSSFGIMSASLVEFDPEIMNVSGIQIFYGVRIGEEIVEKGLSYDEAKELAKKLNEENDCTAYKVFLLSNINIIKITIQDNYGVNYREGTLRISATLNDVPVSRTLRVINDVTIFEYEMVKTAAEEYDKWGYLECGANGYSSYDAFVKGYNPLNPDEYIPEDLCVFDDAAVICTTAFRAIAYKNIRVVCGNMVVDMKNVVPGQKGVNFKYYEDIEYNDSNFNGKYDEGEMEAIQFGFYGDQVILGDFFVTYDTGYTWGTLREAFSGMLGEGDVVHYYILKDGKIKSSIKVDYSLADADVPVVLELFSSNETLGKYEIVLVVPAASFITFDANGGSGAPEKDTMESGGKYTIPKTVPNRKWHTFLGWATSKDAVEPEYLPGDVYSGFDDVTFYAVWQKDAEAKTTISVSSASAIIGGKAKVKVNLSEPADISAMQFAIRYNAEVLDVVSAAEGVAKDSTINYDEDGMIYFVWDSIEPLTSGGTILEIEFAVSENTTLHKEVIDILEGDDFEIIFTDSNLKELAVEVSDGEIDIIDVLFGDVDGNGKINVIDANFVRRHSAKAVSLTEKQLAAADVDGNGKVNVLDANLIRRYAVKLIDKFPVEG